MSLMDQFQAMEEQVARRLRELEPMVAEYQELQQIAQRLGIRPSAAPAPAAAAAATPAPAARRTTRAKASRATSDGRTRRSRRNVAAPGSRQEEVLRFVNERPGITVPEIGKALGVDPTGLYHIVRRLQSRGQIRKDGKQLQPVGTLGTTV